MAGKGRRAASRQGQLNRKRKKTQKGPSGIPSGAQGLAEPKVVEAAAVLAGVEDAEIGTSKAVESNEVPVEDAREAPRRSQSTPATRTTRGEFSGQAQGRLRGERPAAYLYVGAEIRRIMLLTGTVLAVLIVLGIVL